MRATRRSTALAFTTAVTIVAMAGCNPAGPQSTGGTSSAPAGFGTTPAGSLKISGFNPSDEVGSSRRDLAAAKLQGVTITLDTTGFDTQKFAAQVASGSAPDLVQVDRTAIGTLADKGLIMPMDECYSTHGVTPSQRFYPAVVQQVTFDHRVYAVPQFFQPSQVIADTTVLKAAGVDVAQLDTSKPDQLLAAARSMAKNTGGKPTRLGFDGDIPGSTAAWLYAFGGRPNDDDGRPTLDDPKNVQALTWMKQLMDAQGGYAKVKSFKDTMDVFGDQNQYVKHQVGAQTWAQWYINVLSNTKDDVTVTGVPLRDASRRAFAMAGGTAFAIPKASKNPSAACAWALTATSPEAWHAAGAARAKTVTEKKALNTGIFTGSPEADQSIRKDFVQASGNASFDQLIKTSYDSLENPVSFATSPVGQQLSDALSNAVIIAMGGEKTPEQALREAQATALRDWKQSSIGKKLG